MFKPDKQRKSWKTLASVFLLSASLLTGCGNSLVIRDYDGSLEPYAQAGNHYYALENLPTGNIEINTSASQPNHSAENTDMDASNQGNAANHNASNTNQDNNANQETGSSTPSNTQEDNNMTNQNATQSNPDVNENQNTSQNNAQASNKPTPEQASGMTAVELHGGLSVDGAHLVDQYGEQFQLYGMSTHGIGWFPQFVNKDSFRTLRDDWNTNCVRLAMYTHEGAGYCSGGNKDELKKLVHNGVQYATELGMYVIIDWHVLQDQDPNVYKQDALAFFEEMSSTYADYDNVIYEICNEPNGYANWSSVKSYAEEVIPVIRNNAPDSVIIVGTPTWSQDIHMAAQDPLEYDNLMYALHFYAGTHKDDLRNRLDSYVSDGFPVFVSEFGICDASGNGALDYDSASKWMEVIEKHNISFFCWNLANKNESSSVFKESTGKVSDWSESDMNDSGIWFRNYCRSKK